MAFQIKSFTSIVAGMLNHVRSAQKRLTDFNIGSINRTLLEAPAAEIEEAYLQAFNGLREAIPVATYTSFNFDRLPAAPAADVIDVTVTATAEDVVIDAGTLFSTPASSTVYLSQELVTIPAGETVGAVSFVARDAGVIGNLPVSQSFATTPAIPNFVSAINPRIVANGRNEETDDERKQRFVAFISTLPRSIIAGLEYGAKTVFLTNAAGIEIERVKCASVIEPYVADSTQPIAWVKLFVHNGEGSTSPDLVAKVVTTMQGYVDPVTGKKVPGYKAAGVKLDVAAATETPVNLTGTIVADAGYSATALCATAIDLLEKHFLALDNGASSLYKDRVILVGDIPGVANIVFTVGTADVTCAKDHKLMPGTIAITPA
jgi:uncharacterized phage protein gp47/JayE